jgi:superoxide dismutase, Cu-Zn family
LSDQAHMGDLGNIHIGPDGRGRLEFTTDRWTLDDRAATTVVGKSIVIHAEEDDMTSQPDGGAGTRIGCGVIQPKS